MTKKCLPEIVWSLNFGYVVLRTKMWFLLIITHTSLLFLVMDFVWLSVSFDFGVKPFHIKYSILLILIGICWIYAWHRMVGRRAIYINVSVMHARGLQLGTYDFLFAIIILSIEMRILITVSREACYDSIGKVSNIRIWVQTER